MFNFRMAKPTGTNSSYLRPPSGTPALVANAGNVGADPLSNFIANSAFGPYQASRTGRRSTSFGNHRRSRHRPPIVTSSGQSGWHSKTFCIPDGMEIVARRNGVLEVPPTTDCSVYCLHVVHSDFKACLSDSSWRKLGFFLFRLW